MGRRKTHKHSIEAMRMRTREQVMRLFSLDADAYAELHFELAASWLNVRGYCVEVARMFMVSGTFHRWWEQQLMQREIVYLRNYAQKASLERYIGFMVTIPQQPSDVLIRQIKDEAILAFSRDSKLKNMEV